jgi:hypothetical protein
MIESKTDAGSEGTPATEVQVIRPPDSLASERTQGSTFPVGYKEFQITLDLERSAYLRLPEPVNEHDLDGVNEWIDFTKKRLQRTSPTNSGN